MAVIRGIMKFKWLIVLAGVFALAGYVAAFEYKHSDRFFPGVSISGVAVGGRNYQEVLDYFRIKADDLMENGLELNLVGNTGERKVKIPMESAGLTADNIAEYFSLGDWEGAIREAYGFGRGGFPEGMAEQLSLLLLKKNFDFPAIAREASVSSLVARESRKILRPGKPAEFFYGESGLEIAKEASGEKFDLDGIIRRMNGNLAVLSRNPMMAAADPEVPFTTAEKLSGFSDFADRLARSTNLIFYYNGYRWRVSGYRLITWLEIREDGDIGVNIGKLEAFLEKTVASVIDNPPKNGRFEMRYGKLVEIVPGKSGNVVDIRKTAERVEQIVYSAQRSFAGGGDLLLALASASARIDSDFKGGNIEIPVEVVYSEPKISQKTIDQHEIRDLVGKAVTSFAGSSADRRKNIDLGVMKLNGLLIAPGEEFSAVNAIGEISEEEGFVKEYVIKEDRSVKELGGGLCQLATTLFRLALDSGLPITERMNHRYVVGYYGPGLDATIYGPKPDLRFVNDTANYVLLQGRVEGDQLIFEFYGQKDGRRSEISEVSLSDELPPPETRYIATEDLKLGDFQCGEYPRKGITADATYKVFYPDGRINEQNFHSVYQPWPKICLIGIK